MRHKLGIKAAACQQFVMGAAFDHLTLIKCDNINHRKYLEAQIGKRFLAAYITQDDRDRSKLQEWTKRWQTTAVNMPSAKYEDPIIDQRLKSLGITHRLDQCFEADAVVKGQTASSSFKPAILENGVRVMVPPHIETGTRIVVRPEDASYVERAKN